MLFFSKNGYRDEQIFLNWVNKDGNLSPISVNKGKEIEQDNRLLGLVQPGLVQPVSLVCLKWPGLVHLEPTRVKYSILTDFP